jgi:hypothetical protein
MAAPGERFGSGSKNLDIAINMDHDSTIPSTLMPDDFADSKKKKESSDGHPIMKLIWGGFILVAFLALLRLFKH